MGRGALAGPLVVAVVLGDNICLSYAKDSKSLTPAKREVLYAKIMRNAQAIGLGWVSAKTIDKIGLSRSLTKAACQAFSQISYVNQAIIIDGRYDFLKLYPKTTKTVIQADILHPVVSAASIIAKVERDRYMKKLDAKYSGWEFKAHKGYGTSQHLAKMQQQKLTIEHRRSFKIAKPRA